MLLFRPDPKPLTEIQVGESFSVLVTEEDWKSGQAIKAGGEAFISQSCAVALALHREHGGAFGVTNLTARRFDRPGPGGICSESYAHDAADFVDAFDLGDPFPGPTVITFKRKS